MYGVEDTDILYRRLVSMRKRGLLLLAICAMMGVLAGCSSGNEQEVSTGQEVQTSALCISLQLGIRRE